VTYDVAVRYLPEDVVQVGTSLGSFSLSAKLTEALLAEFAPELKEKKASLPRGSIRSADALKGCVLLHRFRSTPIPTFGCL